MTRTKSRVTKIKGNSLSETPIVRVKYHFIQLAKKMMREVSNLFTTHFVRSKPKLNVQYADLCVRTKIEGK